jgi:hypothetical protein
MEQMSSPFAVMSVTWRTFLLDIRSVTYIVILESIPPG